jgi:type III secretory pathway component EscS
VIVHAGAEESYVTVIVSVPTFPAASAARTTIALFPVARTTPVRLQLVVPVAVPEAPVAAFVHVTVVTPTLSDALPPRESGDEAVVYVGDDVGVVIVHAGAVASYVTVRTSVPTFPAASRARTVIGLFPAASVTDATLQAVVPVAVPDAPFAAFVHVTWVTPMLSEALPPSATVPDVVV